MVQPKRPIGLALANSKRRSKISAVAVALVLALGLGSSAQAAGVFDPKAHPLNHADSLWVVVNKARPLIPLKYAPELAVPKFSLPSTNNPYGRPLAKPAALAIVILAKAMKAAGAGDLVLQSGYRSFGEQTYVHNRQVSRYGLKAGEALAARPGYSEHQTGLAADVSALGQGCVVRFCFGNTVLALGFVKTLGATALSCGTQRAKHLSRATTTSRGTCDMWAARSVSKCTRMASRCSKRSSACRLRLATATSA